MRSYPIFFTFVLVSVTALLLASSSLATKPDDLLNLSLNNVGYASPVIHVDPGENALQIKANWPVTVHITQFTSSKNLESNLLTYAAQVKTAGFNGKVYLEMWTHFGEEQYFSKGLESFVSNNSDWSTIQTTFNLEEGQNPDKITLNVVVDGIGTVWVKSVSLVPKSTRVGLDQIISDQLKEFKQ